MAQDIAVQKTEETSGFLNKVAAIGLLAGAFIGSSVVPMVPIAQALGALIGAGVGGCTGGVVGQVESKKKAKKGEQLKIPTFWNQDALLGGLIGLVSARALTMGAASLLSIAAAGEIAVIATAVTATMLVGMYLGGRYGKKCLETEYETRLRENMADGISRIIQHPLTPQLVAPLINNSQITPAEKNFVQELLQESLRSQGQALPPR